MATPLTRPLRTALGCSRQAAVYRPSHQHAHFPFPFLPSSSSSCSPFLRPRPYSSSSAPLRQAIGRITPKRIIIRRPASSSSPESDIPTPSIWRPILFCIGLGTAGYGFAAWYTNAEAATWASKLGGGSWWRKGSDQPTSREMARAKQLEGAKAAQAKVNSLSQFLLPLPSVLRTPLLRIYISYSEWRLNSSPDRVAALTLIVGIGVPILLAWRIRPWEPFMRRWFLHHPVAFGGRGIKWRESVTLFTSVLSHQSPTHLFFNSLALFSFSTATYAYLQSSTSTSNPSFSLPQLSSVPHFYAFLLLAGLFSSLSSHLWTNLFRLPRLLRTLAAPTAARLSSTQALAAHEGILPGLGASGAVYAMLAMTACAFPDSKVSLIFLPFFSFPIGWGMAGMVGVDMLGLIMGWRTFDHVAHLAGAFFGLVYHRYGAQLWTWTRKTLGAREKQATYR